MIAKDSIRNYPVTAVFNSPLGPMVLGANNDSLGYCSFAPAQPLPNSCVTYNLTNAPVHIILALEFLEQYYNGNRPQIEEYRARGLILDLESFTALEKKVYRALLSVPWGKTISYKDLAAKSGVPGGSRFVGNAMAKNSFPVIIPCHRVIKSDGTTGRYSGGEGIKEYLLKFEGAIQEEFV